MSGSVLGGHRGREADQGTRAVEPGAEAGQRDLVGGVEIFLGRGLDIFQRMSDSPFDLATKYQKYREVKAFGITYIREAVAERSDAGADSPPGD